MTILRRMMARPTAPVEQVVELGIDDFAFRRGRKFGSILVDMQNHKVIDLLPDRKAKTAKAWMKAHPEIKIVSRDRGGDYAAAARDQAPQATQIADRFHLYKNLVEAVELTLARCRAEIRNGAYLSFSEAEKKAVEPTSVFPPSLFLSRIGNPLPMPARRESVSIDVQSGLIAMNKSWLFVRRGWGMRRLPGASVSLPERFRTGRKKAPSQKQNDGENDQVVLIRMPAMCSPDGSKGARMDRNCIEKSKRKAIRARNDRFIASCFPYARKCRIIQKAQSTHLPLQDFSAKDAVWLFVRDPVDLDEKGQTTLTAICQASETARTTYQLVQEFRHLLHHREAEKLDDWLSSVRASQIGELQSFVTGVERDKAAVVAGLTFPQNNGLVEGKVNKLKLIKRMGYGRAGFPLLRQRVLHAL